ncbi:PREDICTED: hypertrehalosaemic prohormone-like [Ceratosolen solmsi marchali]|uniref:Hypertrehalosaemic prohormone-like n=1 Tax=Ceratosolen solmsi marchali TaxID=326594 RepID=A0AAJ6YH96_9HYME|nr:PREDICTED: hypertrehalosaemic prohormone-like [Ceratosolen solmsi marchali]
MSKFLRHFFTLLLIIFCIAHLTVAQVTFSKGWGPGKRAALYDSECRINPKSLALMFHTIMAEVKYLMACDHQATINYLQTVEH